MRHDNIFMRSGTVSGDSFIGYEEYCRRLENAIRRSHGITSLEGMHQYGKTSSISNVLEKVRNDDNYIVVDINLDDFRLAGTDDLFDSIIKTIVKKIKVLIKKKDIVNDFIEEYIDNIDTAEQLNVFTLGDFKDIFAELNDIKYHSILVLDEFDYAKYIDSGKLSFLRSLGTESKYGTSIILSSRRGIKNIVKPDNDGSSLVAATQDLCVKGFDIKHREEYYNCLNRYYDIDLSNEEKELLEFYAGTMPKVYSILGHYLVDEKQTKGSCNVKNAYTAALTEIRKYYEVIYNRLKEDIFEWGGDASVISKLYIATGFTAELTPYDIDVLKNKGYIFFDEDNNYFAFSKHFTRYLQSKNIEEMNVNGSAYELLVKTSQKLIMIIEEQMQRFGVSATDKDFYEQLLVKRYDAEGKKYDARKYNSILRAVNYDGTYNTLLYVLSENDIVHAFIKNMWAPCFSQYFDNKLYSDWKECLEFYADARNPLAHRNYNYFSPEDLELLKHYCAKIIKTIEKNQANVAKHPLDKELFCECTIANIAEKAENSILNLPVLSDLLDKQFTFISSGEFGKKKKQGYLKENNVPATITGKIDYDITNEVRVVVNSIAPQGDRVLVSIK